MSILEPEAGIFYGIVWIAVVCRMISRRMHLGSWRKLQLDDYLIMVAMCTDTVLVALMHIVVNASSNLIPPGVDVSAFTPEEIQSRIYGSKLVLTVEQMQCCTIWLVKACLLTMYGRITNILPQHKLVIATAIYVGCTFVIMEILYFGVWCRPFKEYFAVPTNSTQCSAATNHLITNAVFNISSDLIILCIPMPIFFRVRLPLKQKITLICIFCVGTFTITAAVLNKYYSFTHPFGVEWTIWYLRESYTALLCANLPLCYPLIQRVFGFRSWGIHTTHAQRSHTFGANSQLTWEEKRIGPGTKKSRDSFRRHDSLEEMARSLSIPAQAVLDDRYIARPLELEETPPKLSESTLTRESSEESTKKVADPYRMV